MNCQVTSTAVLAVLFCVCLCFVSAADKPLKKLNCWTCQSNTTDDPCVTAENLNDSVHTNSCTGEEPVCMKIYSHVYGIKAGESDWSVYPPVVSRFCAETHPLHDLGCYSTEGIKGKQVTCLCDNKDKCNSASSAALNLGLISLAAILARFL